jgi:hypothetical protein
MALYLREGAEESNIRGLVESCAHNDDITPLIKLVFEAQSLADTTPSIAGACTGCPVELLWCVQHGDQQLPGALNRSLEHSLIYMLLYAA